MIHRKTVAASPRRSDWAARLPKWLQATGDLLRHRQDVLHRIQWCFVALYLSLLLLPVLLPLTPVHAGVARRVALFAEVAFWGIWWPTVILSVLLVGQFWCGVFCPDGTLTEFASRHGRGGKIPPWLRWSGWPLLGFSIIYIYEHLVDAYRVPTLVLLTVGGTTLLAVLTGALLGRGKRVWCRYLCPASSVFSLLSRCAVVHFKVDRAAWDAAPRGHSKPVDCPLLLDVRRLRSNEKCSMCGRCSGHRNAVALAFRAPGREIEEMPAEEARVADALAICFVLAGLGYGVAHGQDGPLQALLQTPPAPVAILLTALLLGSALCALLLASAGGRMRHASQLAYGLIPLAGLGLFLGSLEYSFVLLAQNGVDIASARLWIRMAALATGSLWSLRTGLVLLSRSAIGNFGGTLYAAAVLLLAAAYLLAPTGQAH